MSERVAGDVTTPLTRSDWILVYYNTPFWRELSNQRSGQNPLEMRLLRHYWCHVFKNSQLTPQVSGKTALCAGFWNRASRGFNSFINLNEFGAKDSENLLSSLWNKHVHLKEQPGNIWLLSLMGWSWIMQSVSTWLVGTQSDTQGVCPCKLPIDSLPLQLLAKSPELISDLNRQSRRNFPITFPG